MRKALTIGLLLASALGVGAAVAAKTIEMTTPYEATYRSPTGTWVASVWQDPGTGCQYYFNGGPLTPRLNRDGKPHCPGVPVSPYPD